MRGRQKRTRPIFPFIQRVHGDRKQRTNYWHATAARGGGCDRKIKMLSLLPKRRFKPVKTGEQSRAARRPTTWFAVFLVSRRINAGRNSLSFETVPGL